MKNDKKPLLRTNRERIYEPTISHEKPPVTPIFVKTSSNDAWPDHDVFYIMASNGLFRCRNHDFFTSCVPSPCFPTALEEQKSFLMIGYPLIPRRLVEVVVGFFTIVYEVYRAEAMVLLLWDHVKQRYQLLVPQQTSIVHKANFGDPIPFSVHYEEPVDLPKGHTIVGDIHSHCNHKAYSSVMDKNDETYRTGLHIVVGYIDQDPPDFHAEAVVDGTRFKIDPFQILEGYHRRRKGIRSSWIQKVQIETKTFTKIYNSNNWSNSGDNNYTY